VNGGDIIMNKISIRNATYAIIGLKDMVDYINLKSPAPTKGMIMVEIGSYVGDSTRVFAQNFNHVISVDPYKNGYDDSDTSSYKYPMEDVYKQFKTDILDKFENVQHLRETSDNAVKLFVEKKVFDFVYIDGNHQPDVVDHDVRIWLPKVRINGWIGGHDYNRVKLVVDRLLKPDAVFRDTSWIKRVI
jgi:hypothetical protein